MVSAKAVLGTYFGAIFGFYLILLMVGLFNGLAVRFTGKSVQQTLNETVGGIIVNQLGTLAVIALSVMTVVAIDSQLGLANKVTQIASGNGGA